MHGSVPSAPARRLSVAAVRPLFVELAACGIATRDVLASVGAAPDVLAHDERRLPAALTDAMWVEAARRRPELPLCVAASVTPPSYGLLTYLLASAPTVGVALRGLVRRYALLGDSTTHHLELGARRARVHVELRGQGRPDCVEAFAVAVIVCFLRRQCGSAFAVRHVALRGRTASTGSRATFGVDVEHGASWCGFELDRSALDLRLASADAALMRLLEDHADRIGAAFDDDDDLAQRVRDLLLARGARVGARPADVAAALGMAERTLRRRLALAGCSFRDVLDEVLGEAAERMLADHTVDQVAAELGYAEPAAFRRAHRRWSGAAPRVISPRVR